MYNRPLYSAQDKKQRSKALKLANIGIGVTICCLSLYMMVDYFELNYDEQLQSATKTITILGLLAGSVLSFISLSIFRTRRALWLRNCIVILAALAFVFYLLFKDFCVIC